MTPSELHAICVKLKSEAENLGFKAEIIHFRDDAGHCRCGVKMSRTVILA